MPEPKTDRSAMGLLRRVFKVTQWGDVDALEEELPAAALHARNVDKQRRRLLAERLERDAEALQDSAMVARGWGKEAWAKYGQRHHKRAAKLRTIAARLRGTG